MVALFFLFMIYGIRITYFTDYYILFGKATGGGAYKYADLFKERLGVSLEKEDEMDCLVAGANFLLKVSISKLAISLLRMHPTMLFHIVYGSYNRSFGIYCATKVLLIIIS